MIVLVLSGQKATVRAGGGEIPEPDPDGSTGARLQNALCAAAGHGIIDQPKHHPACLHAAGTGGTDLPG